MFIIFLVRVCVILLNKWVNFIFLHTFCKEMRCFLKKNLYSLKILHDRWSRQISSLHMQAVWKYGEEKPSYAQEIIWKERSEKAFNSPFYRINSGLDFRPLCQDSHRNHHRGLWKRSRMNRKSNEPVLQHTSCYNICFMLCISIFSWTFIWR